MCVEEESKEIGIELSVADIQFLREKANKAELTLEEYIEQILEAFIKD